MKDYTFAFQDWAAEGEKGNGFKTFFIDGCFDRFNNLSKTPLPEHPFSTRMTRIEYNQKGKALDRFYLTKSEMKQMEAVVERLPDECTHIVKLTGKYFSEALPKHLAFISQMPNLPILGLQARGKKYMGWSSELFMMKRSLMKDVLHRSQWHRTEEWLDNVRKIVQDVGGERLIHFFPMFTLKRVVERSGDHTVMSWL